jgi:hypothetical protein
MTTIKKFLRLGLLVLTLSAYSVLLLSCAPAGEITKTDLAISGAGFTQASQTVYADADAYTASVRFKIKEKSNGGVVLLDKTGGKTAGNRYEASVADANLENNKVYALEVTATGDVARFNPTTKTVDIIYVMLNEQSQLVTLSLPAENITLDNATAKISISPIEGHAVLGYSLKLTGCGQSISSDGIWFTSANVNAQTGKIEYTLSAPTEGQLTVKVKPYGDNLTTADGEEVTKQFDYAVPLPARARPKCRNGGFRGLEDGV